MNLETLEYMVMGVSGICLILLICFIVLFNKLNKMADKYNAFMADKEGKSLEKQIQENHNRMNRIEKSQQNLELALLDVSDNVDECLSKVGIVNYDAFRESAGKISFTLAALNKKNDGYILNCMHSASGSYVYVKDISHGRCEKELALEEQEALIEAMKQ